MYSHTLTSMHLHGSRLKRIFVSHLKTLHPRRAMSYTLQNLTPRTGIPHFFETVFQHSEPHCRDQRPQQSRALTELSPLTGYEPNPIAEDPHILALLASPLYLQEREASAERSKVYDSFISRSVKYRENCCSVFDPK